MSFLTRILQTLGFASVDDEQKSNGVGWLNWIKKMFARDDVQPLELQPEPIVAVKATASVASHYESIEQVVTDRLERFAHHEVPSHQSIAPKDIFMLSFIEIHADLGGQPLLDQFFTEFSGKALNDWIKDKLHSTLGVGISFDQFSGISKEVQPLQSGDKAFDDLLNGRPNSTFSVTLYGRWCERMLTAQSYAVPPVFTTDRGMRQAGPVIELRIRDSSGMPRSVQCASYPAVLGSSPETDIPINGFFVSGTHCILHFENNQILLEDKSTNGTWFDSKRLEKDKKCPLPGGVILGFGRARSGNPPGDFARYPEVEPLIRQRAGHTPIVSSVDIGRTPLVAKGGNSTANAGGVSALAVLDIVDINGQSQVLITSVPFCIGRDTNQNYRVPEGNGGASREHLKILSITKVGAQVENIAHAKNGTELDGIEMAGKFDWAFGQELVLATRWKAHTPARIRLLPAGDTQ